MDFKDQLIDLPKVDEVRATKLIKAGYTSLEEIADSKVTQIKNSAGCGGEIARIIIDAAKKATESDEPITEDTPDETAEEIETSEEASELEEPELEDQEEESSNPLEETIVESTQVLDKEPITKETITPVEVIYYAENTIKTGKKVFYAGDRIETSDFKKEELTSLVNSKFVSYK
jgi:septum formation inhibitor MinC